MSTAVWIAIIVGVIAGLVGVYFALMSARQR
jgi:hypothetical protein